MFKSFDSEDKGPSKEGYVSLDCSDNLYEPCSESNRVLSSESQTFHNQSIECSSNQQFNSDQSTHVKDVIFIRIRFSFGRDVDLNLIKSHLDSLTILDLKEQVKNNIFELLFLSVYCFF